MKVPKKVAKLSIISLLFALTYIVNLNMVIPSYVAELGGTIYLLGVIYSIAAIAKVITGVISGFIRDKMGSKPILLASLGFSTLAFFIMFLARDLKTLTIGLVIYYLARGMETPAFLSITAVIAKELSLTATLFGFILALRSVPLIVAPLITGYIVNSFGIRSALLFGTIMSTCSFLIFIFIKIKGEIKKKEEKVSITLSKEYILLVIATFFLFIPVSSLMPTVSYWWVNILHYDYLMLGLIISVRFIVANIAKIYSGYLSDKVGELNMLACVGIIRALAAFILAFTKNPLLIMLAVSLDASLIAAPPRSAYISKLFNEESYGKAFSILSIAQNVAAVVGPFIIGYVAQNYGFSLAFITLGLSLLISTLIIFLIKYVQ